jgi:Abortive infection C-terminus
MASDQPAYDFSMHGSRAAMADGLSHIEEQIKSIERAVVDNPGLAFDLSKTLVESTCRSILRERSISFEAADDLPKLFKAVTIHLPLLPATASSETEARKSLAQTLNGLHTALQGVCELRNAYGFASHGTDGSRQLMESVQALLAAQAADAIVGFLFRVHRQERPKRQAMQLGDHREFNVYIDESNAMIKIFDLEYRPSEVLFSVDQGAYRDLLAGFSLEGVNTSPESPEETSGAPK